jgi:hypothetical protein
MAPSCRTSLIRLDFSPLIHVRAHAVHRRPARRAFRRAMRTALNGTLDTYPPLPSGSAAPPPASKSLLPPFRAFPARLVAVGRHQIRHPAAQHNWRPSPLNVKMKLHAGRDERPNVGCERIDELHRCTSSPKLP